jgi:hypothetical protein
MKKILNLLKKWFSVSVYVDRRINLEDCQVSDLTINIYLSLDGEHSHEADKMR